MAIDSNVKLSNVIGAPFSDYVLLQLYQRAAHNSTLNRSNEEVLFLANKTAWARLVSSVNITNDTLGLVYKDLGVNYSTPDGLAKNWILEAGTSKQKGNGIELRYGIGPDGAYGLGGTDELGYRPMPGLTSVQIETTGRLGSLRQATIQFKVWNMDQLDVVETLYFRLGYSMLLEWGHTQYFDNKGGFERIAYGINDPFKPQRRKEQIQQEIAFKARNSFGNYDGMLGVVSNFTWAMNQDAGYDCTVKLVGLGAVMDSMRINQAYKLPEGTLKQYKKDKDALARLAEEQAALKKQLEFLKNNPPVVAAGSAASTGTPPPPTPKTIEELYQRYVNYDGYKGTFEEFRNTSTGFVIPRWPFPANFNTATKTPESFFSYYAPFKNSSYVASAQSFVISNYQGLYLNISGAGGFKRVPLNDPSTILGINVATLDEAARSGIFDGIYSNSTFRYGLSEVNAEVAKGNIPKPYGQFGISRLFDLGARFTRTGGGPNGAGSPAYLPLTSPLVIGTDTFPSTPISFTVPVRTTVKDYDTTFQITAKINSDPKDLYFQPSRQTVIDALDLALKNPSFGISNVRISSPFLSRIQIAGDFNVTGVEVPYSGPADKKAQVVASNNDANARNNGESRVVPFNFTFTTDNPGFISSVGAVAPPSTPAKTETGTGNTGDTGGTVNKASTEQQDAASGFASALQAMLITVQASAQAKRANSGKSYLMVDISEATSKFFQEGIMNGILDTKGVPSKIPNPTTSEFNLLQYAAKGFNSQLMIDPTLYNDVLSVQFDKLCKAFIVAYNQGGADAESTKLRAPVYISFGYLLAFLNNMCLIYDSPESKLPTNNNPATGTPKRPYVYIDFNPETNFCLTSPQQLSIDPTTCLISFQANQTDYKTIFPEDIIKSWSNKKDGPLFDPGSGVNAISSELNRAGFSFKGENAYQGKIMNVMLNIDYLLGLIASFTGSDPEHAVRLEAFLQRILADVNKALGNTNSFRVAYRDDSNTVQIQDDQWIPSLVKETNMLQASVYNSKLTEIGTGKLSGLIPVSSDPKELPVAGQLSLARQFQLRSVMSTKLASMIAISAQAATGSVNATDHSSLSYLNQNFQDRYKPYIQDASNGNAGTNVNTKNNEPSNDQKAAQMFNTHVTTIYSNLLLNPDYIDLTKNYYIERMSKVKSGDPIVSAAPFIPAELEMTLDGISGIIMGNAFTVPQDRLPLSLRGKNGLAKIAFIVTGLTHTVQNNEWLTKIKGQMIKLRGKAEIAKAADIVGKIIDYGADSLPSTSGGTGGGASGGTDYQLSSYGGPVKIGSITVCPGQYPGAGNKYSCARQVKTIMTQEVFDKQYGYTFVKNKSDINLNKAGLTPLTESEIDKTIMKEKNHFDQGTMPSPVQNFVIHHTAGRGTAKGVVGTFQNRGYPAQYIIDRDGIIHQYMPNGAFAWHAGSYNRRAMGVEVIGDNDKDITKKQIEAAVRLAQYLGFSRDQIIGHGQVPGADKEADEGKTITDYIKTLV